MFRARKGYALVILTLVLTLNFVDRGLIMLLLQPIKVELNLSDSQLGFLTGIAFSLLYATLGLPVAQLADRWNRTIIAAVAMLFWGVSVMSCLFIGSFTQLAVARVAASVGEAGCMPPTYSLLGDYFRGSGERARAMSIYWLGSPLSQLISFILGGWLYNRFGWRATFFAFGIPALLVAALVGGTVVEPRSNSSGVASTIAPKSTWIDALRFLWRHRSTRNLCLGIILTFTLSLGLHPWYAAFMIRSHGLRITELGVSLGLIFGIGGVIGVWLGGYIAARWLADSESGQLRLSAILIAALLPLYALFLLLPQSGPALFVLTPLVIAFNLFVGPCFALLQRLVPDEMRATSLAVVMLFINLVGMGIGAQLVGILSDELTPLLGDDSLRYAMLVMTLLALWAAVHFWKAANTVRCDLKIAESLNSSLQVQFQPGVGQAIGHSEDI